MKQDNPGSKTAGLASTATARSPESRADTAIQRPTSPAAETDSEAFSRVQDLLLGDQRGRVADLEHRLADPTTRTHDLAEVLPEAVRSAAGTDRRLIDALAEPVGACVGRAVSRDPHRFADALFPVMGPAIRRAITESLKGLVQSINQAVEQSFSVRGLRWRLEAWRSGISFAEVVLKHTLVYRVEAAYLIHNHTGLLIDHVVAEADTTLKDEDAVSAMLTAIQDFVQDSFSAADEPLETVEIGQRLLWLLRGPHATLACVISGLPPQALRAELESELQAIHRVLYSALVDFDGDKAPVASAHPMLEQCLALEYRQGAVHRTGWIWWLVVVGLLLAGAAWLGWQEYEWRQRVAAARDELADTPGLVLLTWQPGRTINAAVLADPLSVAVAGPPAERVQDAEVRARLRIDSRPYVSADEPIVLERARRLLDPPAGVTLALEGQILQVAGSAPPAWVERLRLWPLPPPGADSLDLSSLESDGSDLEERVRAALDAPAGVDVSMIDDEVRLSGSAPVSWIRGVLERLAPVAGLAGCQDDDLVVDEVSRARRLAAELEGLRLYFGEGVEPIPGSGAVLQQGAAWMRELTALTEQLPGARLRILVRGYSDGLGDPRRNLWLRGERAQLAVARWRELGVRGELLTAEAAPGFEPSVTATPSDRRVQPKVELKIPDIGACAPPS